MRSSNLSLAYIRLVSRKLLGDGSDGYLAWEQKETDGTGVQRGTESAVEGVT